MAPDMPFLDASEGLVEELNLPEDSVDRIEPPSDLGKI